MIIKVPLDNSFKLIDTITLVVNKFTEPDQEGYFN